MPVSAKARGVIPSLFFVLLPFLFPWGIILSLLTRFSLLARLVDIIVFRQYGDYPGSLF